MRAHDAAARRPNDQHRGSSAARGHTLMPPSLAPALRNAHRPKLNAHAPGPDLAHQGRCCRHRAAWLPRGADAGYALRNSRRAGRLRRASPDPLLLATGATLQLLIFQASSQAAQAPPHPRDHAHRPTPRAPGRKCKHEQSAAGQMEDQSTTHGTPPPCARFAHAARERRSEDDRAHPKSYTRATSLPLGIKRALSGPDIQPTSPPSRARP